MHMRSATRDDIERIAALHAESWRTAYAGIYRSEYLDQHVDDDRLAVWRGRLSAPSGHQIIILAEEAGALHGFVCAYGDDDLDWGSLIDNLHVTPNLKRSGIGTLLMREVAGRLQQCYSRSGIHLWALEANAPARRFYERLGGALVTTVEQETADGGLTPSCRYAWASPASLLEGTQRYA
jgi:ribosomal protein S18 acetylase RimI-like enzyme